MTKTVDDLRNEIRVAVDRHERLVSTAFTKEALAAICAGVGAPVDAGSGSLPSKGEMRARILSEIGEPEGPDAGARSGAFRKGELEAIAVAVDDEEE